MFTGTRARLLAAAAAASRVGPRPFTVSGTVAAATFFSAPGPRPVAEAWKANKGIPANQPPAKLPLKMVSEFTYMPCPGKANPNGEDAWFISAHMVGVADGVGGWTEVGVDPSLYSWGIARGGEAFAKKAEASLTGSIVIEPVEAMMEAWKSNTANQIAGSTTACFVSASADGVVRVRNLGDSGVMVWRHTRAMASFTGPAATPTLEEAARQWTLVYKSTPQQLAFNTPYQMDHSGENNPIHCNGGDMVLLPGDIILSYTDGMSDNLFDEDVQKILARIDMTSVHTYARMLKDRYKEMRLADAALEAEKAGQPKKTLLERRKIVSGVAGTVTDTQLLVKEKEARATASSISALLAVAAQRVGKDTKCKSPFSEEVRRAGYRQQYTGGKLDDVIVIASLVMPDAEAFPVGAPAAVPASDL